MACECDISSKVKTGVCQWRIVDLHGWICKQQWSSQPTTYANAIFRFRQSVRLTDPIPVNAVLFSAMSTSDNLASSNRHPAFPIGDPALSLSKTGLCLPGDCAKLWPVRLVTMMRWWRPWRWLSICGVLISGASHVDLSSPCSMWARHTRVAVRIVLWLVQCFSQHFCSGYIEHGVSLLPTFVLLTNLLTYRWSIAKRLDGSDSSQSHCGRLVK